MTLPKLKTVKKWLPMISGGLFMSWIAFLVVLSLMHSNSKSQPSPASRIPSTQSSSAPGCVTLPDGISICDQISLPHQGNQS
jgi:hypothetical protein